MAPGLTRRRFLEASATTPAGAAIPQHAPSAGRLQQSVCRWTLPGSLPEVCRRVKAIRLQGIDLLYPEEWEVARAAGLTCSMGYPSRRKNFIADGFNDPSLHPILIEEINTAIPRAAQAGVPNLIAMFGNRRGRSDAEGVANCVAGLSKVAPVAEKYGVTVCVELLNSKVDHPDYQGDHTAFGVAVMRQLNSPRVKLLYDIYHMQIMEGDVIRTVRDHQQWIGHFHTGGVPGRHEIDDAQEVNYRGVARAIADLSFSGYVAHEFLALGEPYTALAAAHRTCLV
ncbi:hydroxypyruvate isomerase family protein [Phenylobacterium sp.]|jgi:hydroxypyruvate isomerase|uniref:hydroxypyruvate isomerase family protein n=1 Tax=Phenylobacterium sp. TaxID=1871053 RepID=UPI002F429BA9